MDENFYKNNQKSQSVLKDIYIIKQRIQDIKDLVDSYDNMEIIYDFYKSK